MQRVVFKKLFLLSKKEEAAKEISLSPETTVVLGTNDTGKSSLIKSLYHTLGAHVQFHRKWAEANVIGVLNFIVNEKEYFLLRYQNLFGLFDQDIKPIYIEQGITKGIGIRLNNIFNFNLKLKHSSSKEIVNATPAFQYLPYYVDQDKGWVKLWSSFEDLTHFSGWHRDLIDYHIGIKPKEYYDLSENINSLDIQFKELSSEHRIIQNAQTKVKEKQKPILFDIDIDLFKKEIDRLLQICNKLNKEQENYRIEISNLKNQEQDLDIQLNIAQKSLSEIEKDYEFTLRHNSSLPIQCPTCGTDFENSLINRFSLVEDADSCRNLIIDINKRKKVIKSEISILQDKYNKKSINIEELNNLLIEKKGIIEFHDVIRSQSNKEINNAFNSSLEEIELDSSK
ncbi:MAG: hypothetical protein JW956_15110, partial [Calditrichaceae bacterium]|nr:hypothetical protein [Calditrichaceae bacterium]